MDKIQNDYGNEWIDKEVDNRNHKGEFCPYRKILLCQESYCEGCCVYLTWCEELWK